MGIPPSWAVLPGLLQARVRVLVHPPFLLPFCGFAGGIPHRTTFNRFIQRLSHHPGLVEGCFVHITGRLKDLLPDLGQEVAIDATTVRSYSNPNRKRISNLVPFPFEYALYRISASPVVIPAQSEIQS